jgi:hypothetical protein
MANTHMTRPRDAIASPAMPAHSADRRWRFPALFGMQTIGAGVFFYNAIPLYQQILTDPASHEAQNEHMIWALSAIALMQVAYWISYRLHPPLPEFTNSLLAHVTFFLARMSFVFPTSVFGFLFIARKPEFHIAAVQYAVVLLALFSLYCYTRELESLGLALLGRGNRTTPPR